MRKIAFATFIARATFTGKPSFTDAALSDRQFDLETFFDGEFVALGQFQDGWAR